MKLAWSDIKGQGASRPEAGAALPGQTESAVPVDILGKANTMLDDALDMLRKLDQFAGIFLQLKEGGKTTIEGGRGTMEDTPQSGATPQGNPQAPDTPQVLALLDKILAGEGDIPLSRFINGIRNQEAWLVKYAQEAQG